MRTFIAVEIPDNVKKEISNFILKTSVELGKNKIKWVEEDNIHITLKFLGEVNSNLCKEISQQLLTIAAETKKFNISLQSLGVFPNISSARVLWVDVKENNNELKLLSQMIEDKLLSFNIPKECRHYQPHLTLGRVKTLVEKDKISSFLTKYKNINFGTAEIDHITFFESILSPQGPEYKVISRAYFK